MKQSTIQEALAHNDTMLIAYYDSIKHLTIQEVLALDPPDFQAEAYRLYLIRDGETVFYVGQSNNPHNRLLSHLGLDGRGGLSAIGRFILKNAPASDAWLFEQYTVEEVIATFEEAAPRKVATDPTLWLFTHYQQVDAPGDVGTAEKALIAHYRPCFNKIANPDATLVPERYQC